MAISIREESRGDHERVHEVVCAAFESQLQADLVMRLRLEANPYLSLVAVENGALVGHISFSPMTIESGPQVPVAQLSPVSVLPARQGEGIGGALIESGLTACRALWVAVFLVGNPRYYSRFGFHLIKERFFTGGNHDQYLQLMELEHDSLVGLDGKVSFHPAFDDT